MGAAGDLASELNKVRAERDALRARLTEWKALLGSLWEIADKAGMVCAIFEVHEYPEIEAQPVVADLRKLLARKDVRWFMVWGASLPREEERE